MSALLPKADDDPAIQTVTTNIPSVGEAHEPNKVLLPIVVEEPATQTVVVY